HRGGVRTEACTYSDGATSGSVDNQTHIKMEELEGEGYISLKFYDDDAGEEISDSMGLNALIDQHIHVKKEEPEGGGTSSAVENQQSREFRIKYVKEEGSEDEDYLCATTVY
ncbi:zinc finger protein, partial [Clarias magur]